MDNYSIETYGQRIAEIYDDLYQTFDPASIDFLAEIARGKQTLELGIGTGRIALPLFERGVPVDGVDASVDMVEQLKRKSNGASIPIEIGDFAEVNVNKNYELIYIVFNTFFALTSQDSQLNCMINVARNLNPTGRFVIEAFVPDLARFTGGQTVRVTKIDADEVRLEVSTHNPLEQLITSQHIFCSNQGIKLYPIAIRYAWPSELDMMARAAGLKLYERWENWNRKPFTRTSGRHISVYGLQQE